jgi:hypothetical protein
MSSSFDPQQHTRPDITSETHPLPVFPVHLAVGTVYLTLPPGFRGTLYRKAEGVAEIRRDLSADVARLDGFGIKRLVTVMSAEGILQHGLGGLLTDLDGFGIAWTHLPFPPYGVEDVGFPRYLAQEIEVIRLDMSQGRKVAIHGSGWGPLFEGRLRKILCLLDPELSPPQVRALTTATLRSANAMSPM